MKRIIIILVLLAGSVGTVNAAQTIVAGPLTVDPNATSYDILLCSASNLSNETQTYNLAFINFEGTIVDSSAGQAVDSFHTITSGNDQAQLCVWEINGSPESWRFTACTGQSTNTACTGGAIVGKVAPGVKFPE